MAFQSVNAVFETYEILETILHKLPIKDILFAQRVCKSFKEVIARSRRLQRALFFEQVSPRVTEDRRHCIAKRLVRYKHFNRASSNSSTHPPQRPYKNPLLVGKSDEHKRRGYINTVTLPSKAWTCPEASWKRMYLTQPATLLEIRTARPFGRPYSHFWLNDGGQTASEIHAMVRGQCKNYEGAWSYSIYTRGGCLVLEGNQQIESLRAKTIEP